MLEDGASVGVRDVVFEVPGWRLSAKRAEPARDPRATVVALPGGGYTSSYWHHPLDPDASLLDLGAALGYRVVAVDRPGYGLAQDGCPDGVALDDQIKALASLVDMLGAERGSGAGVFLIGHSYGGILALTLASLRPSARLLGVDVSGVPRHFSDDLATAVDATLLQVDDPAALTASQLFYGPAGTYNPALTSRSSSAAVTARVVELEDSKGWPEAFPAIAGRITIPVQFTLGDHERVTRTGWPALREVAELFKASPRIVTQLQLAAGHNISLHHVGRAYHLRALAFFDELLTGN